jgi:hypothetical protein
VRVIYGGADPGDEVFGVQFTNTGSKKCTLYGYPTVTLLRDGRQIGRPSQPSTTQPSVLALAPGEVAESLLHDYTQACNAPLSDTVKVLLPGSTQIYMRPQFQRRACVLRADKLRPY